MTNFPWAILLFDHCKWSATYVFVQVSHTNARVISFQIFFDSFTPLPKQNQLFSSLQSPHRPAMAIFSFSSKTSTPQLNLHGDSWRTCEGAKPQLVSNKMAENMLKSVRRYPGYLLAAKPFAERQQMPWGRGCLILY